MSLLQINGIDYGTVAAAVIFDEPFVLAAFKRQMKPR